MVLEHIFFLHFRNSRETWWDKGPTACLVHSPDLNPLYFYLREHLKSTVYAKEVSDIQVFQQRSRQDLRWLVRHLEFSSESGDHCSNMQDPVLMLELDTEHFHYSSGARNSERMLQKPYIQKTLFFFWFCFVLCVDLHAVGLAVHFSFTLYVHLSS